jgi:phosphotransferase system enzyme I (PtsI)
VERYLGQGAAPGIGIGPAVVWHPQLPDQNAESLPESPAIEQARLGAAVEATKRELVQLKSRTEHELGLEEAQIFSAHLLMLTDPALVGAAMELIEQGQSAVTAMANAVMKQAAILEQLPDEYMAERAVDVRDVGARVLSHLQGQVQQLPLFKAPSILVSKELTPSLTAQLPKDQLLGFVTEAGGRTSHVAIMARSLGIPAVVGLDGISDQIDSGQLVVVDGITGKVLVEPTDMELTKWKQRQIRMESRHRLSLALASEPAVTPDGYRVALMANIGHPSEAEAAIEFGAEGVGLFRTEFLYMDRKELPNEDEQTEAYQQVAAIMAPRPVIIRTLDIGGDKDLPYLGLKREDNPFLGWRALRYSLSRPGIFRTQLRAILRAAATNENIRIMLPLVVAVEEIREAKSLLIQAEKELDLDKIPHGKQVKLGIMVETPAAAIIADKLAQEVDFFSIGTNDLIQYTLAADRQNRQVEKVFDPLHPAILRLIDATLTAGSKAGIEVGLCGELAGEPRAAPLLLGLGLTKFSMATPSLLPVKEKVRSWSFQEAQALATEALSLSSGTEVRALLKRMSG